ncbi:MAG: hypothetical protein ABIO88_09455 [Burkholderiaceae bacterium]
MPHFDPRHMHLPSCYFIGGKRVPALGRLIVQPAREAERNSLYEVGPAVQENIVGAAFMLHSVADQKEALVLTGEVSPKIWGDRLSRPSCAFKSVLIDFAAENIGACRTHTVRTAGHAATPTPNRSLRLKRPQFRYNLCGFTCSNQSTSRSHGNKLSSGPLPVGNRHIKDQKS